MSVLLMEVIMDSNNKHRIPCLCFNIEIMENVGIYRSVIHG